MSDTKWTLAWRPLIDRVGTDLDGPGARFGPDAVELGAIRRWLEPLEFDCALHRDADAARAQGWPDVIAPYTAVWSFGEAGTIRAIRDFRMVRFTPVGSVARVQGRVVAKQLRDGVPVVVIELRTVVENDITVGPGTAEVTLPE